MKPSLFFPTVSSFINLSYFVACFLTCISTILPSLRYPCLPFSFLNYFTSSIPFSSSPLLSSIFLHHFPSSSLSFPFSTSLPCLLISILLFSVHNCIPIKASLEIIITCCDGQVITNEGIVNWLFTFVFIGQNVDVIGGGHLK